MSKDRHLQALTFESELINKSRHKAGRWAHEDNRKSHFPPYRKRPLGGDFLLVSGYYLWIRNEMAGRLDLSGGSDISLDLITISNPNHVQQGAAHGERTANVEG